MAFCLQAAEPSDAKQLPTVLQKPAPQAAARVLLLVKVRVGCACACREIGGLGADALFPALLPFLSGQEAWFAVEAEMML